MRQHIPSENQSDTGRTLVVGAGFVGVATAIWLLREGRDVTLIDKAGPRDRASFGNAGVLASSSVLPVTMPGMMSKIPKMMLSPKEAVYLRWSYAAQVTPWALRYLSHANETDARRIAAALTPILGNSLEDHQALSRGSAAAARIRPCDFAMLYPDRKAFAKDPLPWDIRKEQGFTWSEYDGPARAGYEQVFAPEFSFLAALGGHGQITDPAAYLAELTDHFVKSGGHLVPDQVVDIAHENGRVTGVRTKTDFIPGGSVAITAGAWSPLLTKKLGVKIPVEAESGYHLEFWGANIVPEMPTLVPGYKFILTPMEGRLRVAGAVEFGGLKNKGRDAPYSLLKTGVDRILPGLTYDKETRWMGHRPAPTDSVPVIDQLPGIKGVYLGFGHQHVGLTGSARTGQLLAQMITGKTPNIEMSAYRASRFIG